LSWIEDDDGSIPSNRHIFFALFLNLEGTMVLCRVQASLINLSHLFVAPDGFFSALKHHKQSAFTYGSTGHSTDREASGLRLQSLC
jgi:hypothetical protein